MSKITKNERISTLEDAVAMNWSDMKKVETKISRAMTDMATRISNMSLQLEGQQRQIHLAAESIGLNKQAIIILENKAKPDPQLKTLDQSVFNGLDEKWRFAAVDLSGEAWVYREQPKIDKGDDRWSPSNTPPNSIGTGYDTSNWQNSLIERDTAKELLEVDLSSELTGSELCKAMLARGDRVITCLISNESDDEAIKGGLVHAAIITDVGSLKGRFVTLSRNFWSFAIPINNQGEPLTASEVGL